MRGWAVLVTAGAGCAGFVGDPGFCPELPLGAVELDAPIVGFGFAVQELPVFADFPPKAEFSSTSGPAVSATVSLTANGASVAFVDDAGPGIPRFDTAEPCHEVVTTYRIAFATDDGAFDIDQERTLTLLQGDAPDRVNASVPFAANLGTHHVQAAQWATDFLVAHPELEPTSLQPVAYTFALDVSTGAPRGTVDLLWLHDPLLVQRDGRSVVRTTTSWRVGTF